MTRATEPARNSQAAELKAAAAFRRQAIEDRRQRMLALARRDPKEVTAGGLGRRFGFDTTSVRRWLVAAGITVAKYEGRADGLSRISKRRVRR